MRKNLIPKCFLLLALTFNALCLFSQPLITEVTPPKMYTQNESQAQGWGPVDINLEIKVKNLLVDTISGFNFKDRVQLYFKKGDKLQHIATNGHSFDVLYASMLSSDWLTDATPVGIYVEVDGVRSNTYYFQVMEIPRIPPVITTSSPIKWTINKNRTIRITGKYLGEVRTTKVKVNGTECLISMSDYYVSYIDFIIPPSVAETPGTYPLVVQSIFGTSNTVSLIVQKPPINMIVPKVQPAIAPTPTKPLPKEAEKKKDQQ